MTPGKLASKPRLTFNLCNHPSWALADVEFQRNPAEVHVGRIREDNRRLFDLLDAENSAVRRGEIFHEYLSVQFALHQWPAYEHSCRRSLRNSYVRYLRGWAMDSNSVEGAVLKGWVASRMGIPPTFHHDLLREGSSAWSHYAINRMKGFSFTNGIESQLDLLFEFCQYELKRRRPGQRWLKLYRGTFDANSYPAREGNVAQKQIVTLNNLCSFTADRECAWEFGSTVWEALVPAAKVFFFSDLLPESILKGEAEFLVVGGEYEVSKLLF